jgi:hypothetical protein
VLRSRVLAGAAPRPGGPGLYADGLHLRADCGRGVLQILRLEIDGEPVDAAGLEARFGAAKLPFS